MPRDCDECDVSLPDAITVRGQMGTRGVKYCPFCGNGVGPDDR